MLSVVYPFGGNMYDYVHCLVLEGDRMSKCGCVREDSLHESHLGPLTSQHLTFWSVFMFMNACIASIPLRSQQQKQNRG